MSRSVDLVVCSLEDWDEVWRRNQFLVAGLLRSNPRLRVLFVEPPSDPIHAAMASHRPKAGRGIQEVDDLIGVGPGRLWRYQPTKWLPRRIGGDVDVRLAKNVARVARGLGFSKVVLWINNPSAAALLRTTGWPSLYDMTDDWLAAQRSDREHAKLVSDENELMRDCVEVVVCSTGLAATKSLIRDVTLIRNGVDVDRFRAPTSRPTDLGRGRHALYVGTIHRDRIDIELCAKTASALRVGGAGSLALLGPAPLSDEDRARLIDAGATILGARSNRAVPGYLQHADALVVPHIVDEFTDSLDPIKLYEYQAVGRPIISTPVAGFRELPAGSATVADGEEFVAAVVDALSGPELPPGPLGDAAGVPTWLERVAEMDAVIDRVAAAR